MKLIFGILFFILPALFSMGMSRVPDADSSYVRACKLHLKRAIHQCDNAFEVHLKMSAFYRLCAMDDNYQLGLNPEEERTALGCWIKVHKPTLTQKEAEKLSASFDFSTIFKKRLKARADSHVHFRTDYKTQVCRNYLRKSIHQCDNVFEVKSEMNAFYKECLVSNAYQLGSNPAEERSAMGCWVRSEDPTLTQQEAEKLAESESFHSGTLFKYGFTN